MITGIIHKPRQHAVTDSVSNTCISLLEILYTVMLLEIRLTAPISVACH